MNKKQFSPLSGKIISSAIEVHKALGAGFFLPEFHGEKRKSSQSQMAIS
jgi:hypothetical protein